MLEQNFVFMAQRLAVKAEGGVVPSLPCFMDERLVCLPYFLKDYQVSFLKVGYYRHAGSQGHSLFQTLASECRLCCPPAVVRHTLYSRNDPTLGYFLLSRLC